MLNSHNSATLSFSPELKDSRGRPGSLRCQGSTFGVPVGIWGALSVECSAGRWWIYGSLWSTCYHSWTKLLEAQVVWFFFFFLPWCIVHRQKKRKKIYLNVYKWVLWMLLALNTGKLLLCANILYWRQCLFKIKPPTLSCEQSKTVFCSESGDLRNLCIATSSVLFGIVGIKKAADTNPVLFSDWSVWVMLSWFNELLNWGNPCPWVTMKFLRGFVIPLKRDTDFFLSKTKERSLFCSSFSHISSHLLCIYISYFGKVSRLCLNASYWCAPLWENTFHLWKNWNNSTKWDWCLFSSNII